MGTRRAAGELEIRLETCTPLWTGGVGATTDRLHETGLMGSLRWWGEVVLRSQGGSACDPSQHTCPDKGGRYCDACAIFGTTGLKRSFCIDWDLKVFLFGVWDEQRIRLIAKSLNTGIISEDLKAAFHDNGYVLSDQAQVEVSMPDVEWRINDQKRVFIIRLEKGRLNIYLKDNPDSENRLKVKVQGNRGWYLNRALFLKEHPGRLSVIRSPTPKASAEGVKQFLALLLRIASDWGGIGARTQQGYGVVRVTTEPELNLPQAIELVQDLQNRSNRKSPSEVGQKWPRLDEFFFAKVRIELQEDPKGFIKSRTTEATPDSELQWYLDKNILPLAPIVRYHLRQLIHDHVHYKGGSNAAARWKLMGALNAQYHKSDFGKVESIWQCLKCHRTWTSKPPRPHKDSRGRPCNGRVEEVKWKCNSCQSVWTLKDDLCKETEKIERWKSLIHVSHAYSVSEGLYEFRLWGWIPPELPGEVSRNYVLSKLREWLGVGNPSYRGFQKAQDGELWDASHLNLEAPLVLWLESPTLEKLVQGTGGSTA